MHKIINNTENWLHSSVKQPTSVGPYPDNEPLLCQSKFTNQTWNLYEFKLPLNSIADLVAIGFATDSVSSCKLRTLFLVASHQAPLDYNFNYCNS